MVRGPLRATIVVLPELGWRPIAPSTWGEPLPADRIWRLDGSVLGLLSAGPWPARLWPSTGPMLRSIGVALAWGEVVISVRSRPTLGTSKRRACMGSMAPFTLWS